MVLLFFFALPKKEPKKSRLILNPLHYCDTPPAEVQLGLKASNSTSRLLFLRVDGWGYLK
jgi:hypothetical protein